MISTEKLIFHRKKNGFTQEALAEKLEVSRQAISLWERGETFPSSEKLQQLSELYGVSVDYLMNGDPEQATAAVAVMEKPEPKKPWQKPALIGVAIGFAIVLVVALLAAAYFAGYNKGVEDATPSYPVYIEIVNEADIEGTADLIGW